MKSISGALVVAVVAAGLCAGCGSSSPSASFPTSTSAAKTPVSHASGSRGTTTTTTTTGAGAGGGTVSNADLAALRQELGAAGRALDGAKNALAASDPNQTKHEEGTAP